MTFHWVGWITQLASGDARSLPQNHCGYKPENEPKKERKDVD